MSSVVAVAGGTGGLGRAIVDALKANAKLTVLVLSRQVSQPLHTTAMHPMHKMVGA